MEYGRTGYSIGLEACEKPLADKATYNEIGTKNPTKLLKGKIQRKIRVMKKSGHIGTSTMSSDQQ